MTRLKRDEVVVLIGAGASVEAGIPHSAQMVERIEDLITTNKEWQKIPRPLLVRPKRNFLCAGDERPNWPPSIIQY